MPIKALYGERRNIVGNHVTVSFGACTISGVADSITDAGLMTLGEGTLRQADNDVLHTGKSYVNLENCAAIIVRKAD